MQTCYLVGASPSARRFEVQPEDFIIAADGGLNHLRRWGIQPNFIVGDMDSIEGTLPRSVPVRAVPPDKDHTDMALALGEGYARGYRIFEMIGAAGGRPDHAMSNMQLLVKAARLGTFTFMRDSGFCVTALVHSGELRLRGRGTVSVMACGEAQRVNLRGLKYPMEAGTLRDDSPLGISNELDGDCLISMESGALFVYWEDKGVEPLMNI